MARSYLRLTDDEFWDMAPKCFLAMMDEWRGIEDYRAQLAAYLNQGGTLPGKDDDNEEECFDVHPDAF